MANVDNNTSLLVEKIVTTITELITSACEKSLSSGYNLQFTEDERDSLKQTLQMLELQNTETIDERVSIIIKIINLLLATENSDSDDSDDETPSDKGRSIQIILPILQALNSHNQNIDTTLLSSYNSRGKHRHQNRYHGKSTNRFRSKHIYEFEVEENKMGLLLGKKGSNIDKARKIEGIDRIVINGNICKIMGQTEDAMSMARDMLEFKVLRPKNVKPTSLMDIPIQESKITKESKCKDEFEVEEDKMGLLFGVKGSNIEKARKIEGIDNVIISGNKCKIFGQNMEAVNKAKDMLHIREEKILIDKYYMGKFIGRGGLNVEQLKAGSGLKRINVLDKKDTDDHDNYHQITKITVSLIGNDESIKKAKMMILVPFSRDTSSLSMKSSTTTPPSPPKSQPPSPPNIRYTPTVTDHVAASTTTSPSSPYNRDTPSVSNYVTTSATTFPSSPYIYGTPSASNPYCSTSGATYFKPLTSTTTRTRDRSPPVCCLI